jgi:uncharacterized damage-inducible protein DinB
MYATIKEYVDDWNKESATTLKVLKALTDKSLDFPSWVHGKNLGELAWHVNESLTYSSGSLGFKVTKIGKAPEKATAIVATYKELAETEKKNLEQWSDEQLKDIIPVWGRQLSRSAALDAKIRHEIHHRGQLTLLMRMAGLKVPGVYGPSFEEMDTTKK